VILTVQRESPFLWSKFLSTECGSGIWSLENLYVWQSNDGCQSRWSSDLKHGPAAIRLLRLLVKIPLVVWMFVSWGCCVLSGIILRRANHSSGAVVPRVVCLNVISKPQRWEVSAHKGCRAIKNKDATGFSPSTSVFSYFTNVPYSFIRHIRCITLATDNFVKQHFCWSFRSVQLPRKLL
jgi:hypothetical protein